LVLASTRMSGAEVTVIRGATVETTPGNGGKASAPTVLRGAPARPQPEGGPAIQANVGVAPAVPGVTASETLWRVDPESGQVRACWTRGTGMVGEYVIQCVSGR